MNVPSTMIPVTGAAGLPGGTVPEGTVGVELGLSGLELARPATLLIQPRASPPVQTVVLSTGPKGQEAGFELYTEAKRGIAIEIDHFSSYLMMWPVGISEARLIARRQLTKMEDRYRSLLASYLAIVRQQELNGQTPFYTREYVIDTIAAKFISDVLEPRLAVAGNSCLEAQDAIRSLIAFGRELALLGWVDIPSVDTMGKAGWGYRRSRPFADDPLLQGGLRVLQATCNFPGLLQYYYDVFSRGQQFLGYDPEGDMLDLATGYLTRCGRFRFTLSTSWRWDDPFHPWITKIETTREFTLQWEPDKAGFWGVFGSRVGD